jgi:hypothetical protein
MLVKLLKNRGDQMSTAISVRLPEKLAMDIDEIALETEGQGRFTFRKQWKCISKNMQIYR